jgi:hypothetical protein
MAIDEDETLLLQECQDNLNERNIFSFVKISQPRV